jgi:UDP-glucose 4-epimerase
MKFGKILITGGAGYIGSHVVKLLGQKNCDIIVVDNLSTGKSSAVKFGQLKIFDLAETKKLEQLIVSEKIETVLHFAGSIVVPESVVDPLKYYQNNAVNSYQLIALCCRHQVKNFIFSSTAAVYGFPEGGKANEEALLCPESPYGKSKMMTEWMLADVTRASSLKYVAIRYFNVAGADRKQEIGQSTPNATHLIKLACQTALGKRPYLEVFGTDYPTRDGTCIRDYIHVEDLAQAHYDAMLYLQQGGPSNVVNCGYGEGFTVKEVINMVKKVSGVDFKVIESPRRAGDPASVVAIADKIKNKMNWLPKLNDLEIIVKTAFEWEKKLLGDNL